MNQLLAIQVARGSAGLGSIFLAGQPVYGVCQITQISGIMGHLAQAFFGLGGQSFWSQLIGPYRVVETITSGEGL